MTYMTIHEFGSLRGVSVGSLRYYEKLGLLKPAKVDPDTGYRYYLPEQLEILDVIQMCVALDIPLKELREYLDQEGHLDMKGILMRGRQVLMGKLDQMNTTLKVTEYGLRTLRENECWHDRKGVYRRRIEERWYYVYPASGEKKKLPDEQKELLHIFRNLQEKNKAPFFPAGIQIDCLDITKFHASYLIRVLHPGLKEPHLIHIPEGNYLCLQKDMAYYPDAESMCGIIKKNFPSYKGQSVIITNMMTDKMHYRSRLSEIEIPDD